MGDTPKMRCDCVMVDNRAVRYQQHERPPSFPRKRNRSQNAHSNPTVYVSSVDIFRKLGTTAGQLVSITTVENEQVHCPRRRILARLQLLLDEHSDAASSEHTPLSLEKRAHIGSLQEQQLQPSTTTAPLVFIDDLAALYLGWSPSSHQVNDRNASPGTTVKTIDIAAVSSSLLPVALECTLLLVGRPIVDEHSGPPPLPPSRSLLQSGALVRVSCDGKEGCTDCYFYQVLYVVPFAELGGQESSVEYGCLSTVQTKYHFQPPRSMMIPRLPPLIGSNNWNSGDGDISHPDVARLVELWESYDDNMTMSNIKSNKNGYRIPRPEECIWHMIGSCYDHHVSHAVQCAAARVGRRCVVISGLAATAHLQGSRHVDQNHKVTTGGLADKLVGLQCALEMAIQHAPSVLLLTDLCQELSRQDAGLRAQEESRMWSLVVDTLSSLSAKTVASPLPHVPAVLVVFNTRQALEPSTWMQNLVFSSLQASLPNDDFIEFLWREQSGRIASGEQKQACTNVDKNDQHLESSREDWKGIPIDAVKRLMKGRAAGKILEIQHQLVKEFRRNNDADTTKLDVLEGICRKHDETRRHAAGGSRIPSTKWEDVGGLANVRREILDAIELPLKYPQMFCNGAGRSGMLLYGPPGTGKTLVAKAVATECGLPFLSIKGPELLGSYVGESEAQVRSTFQQARELARHNQPNGCILFFDELDSLAPRRGDQAMGGNVMDRVVASLLSELDKDYGDGAFVFCMGATNRPDLLDPALLRPGRLDRLVYLGVSPADHAAILATQLSKLRLDGHASNIAAELVMQLPPNLTGADLSTIASGGLLQATERLCREADRELHERLNEPHGREADDLTIDDILASWDEERLEPVVTMADLLAASKAIVPSVSAEELKNYERLGLQFSNVSPRE